MATRTEYARYETIYASAELAAANEVDSMPHLFTNWGCGFAWVAVSLGSPCLEILLSVAGLKEARVGKALEM